MPTDNQTTTAAGIEVVDRVIRCCSSDCDRAATRTVFWPGQTKPMCDRCVARAKNIAGAMGFTLPTEPIGSIALTKLESTKPSEKP